MDRDMCVHQLQRKSMSNNTTAPLELSTQLQIKSNQSEAKENQFAKLQAHVAARSHWQIESCHLTPRCATCHLSACLPASESPSAALWLLLTMAKAKKKRKKSAQKTETQMKTHINCAFVSINEQGPTHNSNTWKTLAQKMTFHSHTHIQTWHTHTLNALGNYLVHFMPHYLCFCHLYLLLSSRWAHELSQLSVFAHTNANTHTRTHLCALSYDSF